MSGQERRQELLNIIRSAPAPVSGAALARELRVSRQVIVQDIALIRASGFDIISTNRGYILNMPAKAERVLKVQHTDGQVEEELYAVVDLGGCVKNVMVHHRVYGHIEAGLYISSRREAAEFMEDIRRGKSSPLKNITSDYHYHTISADSERTLDMIEEMLREKGFLIE